MDKLLQFSILAVSSLSKYNINSNFIHSQDNSSHFEFHSYSFSCYIFLRNDEKLMDKHDIHITDAFLFGSFGTFRRRQG